VETELLDLSKYPVDIAGILSQDPDFERQGIDLPGAVVHLPGTRNSLIGVNP
jgi:hypothetical protein